MSSQYTHTKTETTSPELRDNVTEELKKFDRARDSVMRHYNELQEQVILQQNEIAKMHREINRLKNQVDTLTNAMNRRG